MTTANTTFFHRIMDSAPTSHCAKCGKTFHCGSAVGEKICWCMSLPALPNVDADMKGCYCPECLRELLNAAAA